MRPRNGRNSGLPIGRAVATWTPAVLHGLPVFGVDQDARAQAVGHRPAGDIACGGPFQRLDHLESVVVRQPDVEGQMDMILRGIDIRDHGLDGRVGIRQQARAVAAHGLEAIDRMADPEQGGVSLRNFRLKIWPIHSRGLGQVRHGGQHRAQATHTAAADTGFTEEDISQDADHRQNNHDHDPGHPRSRLPVWPQNDSRNHAEVDQEKNSRPQCSYDLTFSHSAPGSCFMRGGCSPRLVALMSSVSWPVKPTIGGPGGPLGLNYFARAGSRDSARLIRFCGLTCMIP